MKMRRRLFLQAMAAATAFAADSQIATVRGKLMVREGKPSTVETPESESIALDGDEPTQKVLNDRRLNGFEIEAKGKFSAPGRFTLSAAHLSSAAGARQERSDEAGHVLVRDLLHPGIHAGSVRVLPAEH